jgi:hypothetical protein
MRFSRWRAGNEPRRPSTVVSNVDDLLVKSGTTVHRPPGSIASWLSGQQAAGSRPSTMSGQSGLPSSSYSQSSSHLPSRPPILPPPKDVHHYKDWVPSNSKDDGWGRSRPVSRPQDEGEGSHKYTSGYSSQGGRSADQGYPDKRYRNHQ